MCAEVGIFGNRPNFAFKIKDLSVTKRGNARCQWCQTTVTKYLIKFDRCQLSH